MNRPLSSKLLLLVALGFGILIVLMIAAGTNNTQADTQEVNATPVNVQTITLQPSYRYAQRVLARVETINTSATGFDTAGLVTTVHVDEGEKVNQGDLLAELDTDRLDARKKELESALKRAKAERYLAALTQKRTKSLVDQGVESGQILDEANASAEVSRARYFEVKAQLDTLAVELERAQLRAPFAATIVQRHVDPGVSVTPGQPIVTIQSAKQLELRASLPANLVQTLNIGDTVAFARGDFTATLDRFVVAQNTQTRTQDALFKVDSPEWQGVSGEIINLVVPVNKPAKGVWVPISALSSGIRGMWTVYVVNQAESNRIESRIVEIIYTDGQRAYISGALSEGEKLITEGTQRLVPGQLVTMRKG